MIRSVAAILLFAALAPVVACRGDSYPGLTRLAADGGTGNDGAGMTGDAPPICTPAGWCWESPLPVGDQLQAVWASADDDVWVVAEDGVLLHWDGVVWDARDFGDATLLAIWGAARDDVWVAGTSMLHFDGSDWTPVDVPTTDIINDLSGTGAGDVWAAGSYGTMLHFDGAAWTSVDVGIPAGSGVHLSAVWAGDARDVWAVGDHFLFHYDGAAWSTTPFDSNFYLRSLWGSGASDVWTFAIRLGFPFGGTLLHFDGAAWTAVDGATGDVWRIVGTAPDDVSVLGRGIDHFDGTKWTHVSNDGTFMGGWALGRGDAWTVGGYGKIAKWDGKTWTYAAAQVTPARQCLSLDSIWASAADDVWAVGGWGTILHSNGRGWSVAVGGCAANDNTVLASVFGTSASDVWAVGTNDNFAGAARHFDGTGWRNVELPASTLGLGAVWGSRPDDVWLVGYADRLHWNGSAFESFPVGGDADPGTTTPQLNALWGRAADDVWAAGQRSMVAHWDGTKWTATHVPSRFDYDFDAIWGSGASDVWFSGENGTHQIGALIHWDGRTWTETPGGTSRSGVWGAAADDVWASGCDDTVCGFLHWDGSAWRKLAGKPAIGRLTMFGLADGNLWAIGGFVGDVILHRRP